MLKLQYLSLAQRDLLEIVDYIADTLEAPKAADELLDELGNAFERLRAHPYSCRVYQPLKSVDLEYRLLVVKHYLVFYVVLEDAVEIHRVIHGRRDLPEVIK